MKGENAPVTAVPQRDVLTAEEFRVVLDALSKADKIRLQKKATFLCGGSGLEADDLIQEAVRRSLEDEGRNCPRDVNPVVFLGNVMRSIASAEREKWARELPVAASNPGTDPILLEPDSAPDPERITLGLISFEQTINRIEALFANDSQALAIVMGDMDGCSPDEIRELEPMTEKEYAAARKRVRRAFQKAFPKGIDHEK